MYPFALILTVAVAGAVQLYGQSLFDWRGARIVPPAALVIALLLTALGVLFARFSGNPQESEPEAASQSRSPAIAPRVFAAAIAILSLLFLFFLAFVKFSDYGAFTAFTLWLLLLTGFAAVMAGSERSWQAIRNSFRTALSRELLLVILAALLFVSLHALILCSWRYSLIGDEYIFLSDAQGIIEKWSWPQLFSPQGTYSYPRMGGWLQALVMMVFGATNAAWRLSSVLIVASCIPPFFYTLKWLWGRSAAVFAVLFFIACPFLTAFALNGLINMQVFFPVIWGIFMLAAYLRSGMRLPLYLSGLCCGLGVYTVYSGNLATVFCSLILLAHLVKRRTVPGKAFAALALFLLGFLSAAGPLLLELPQYLENIRVRSLPRSPLLPGIINSIRVIFAPAFYPAESHYLFGTLFLPLTAAFALVGIGICARRFRSGRHAGLLLTYLALAGLSHGFTQYHWPPPTRLILLIPWISALAGLGAAAVSRAGRGHFRETLMVLAALLILSRYKYDLSLIKSSFFFPESLVIRAAQQHPEARVLPLYQGQTEPPFLAYLKGVYDLSDRLEPTPLEEFLSRAQRAPLKNGTIIILDADTPPSLVERVRALVPKCSLLQTPGTGEHRAFEIEVRDACS